MLCLRVGFYWDNVSCGGKFFGVNSSGENLDWGDLNEYAYNFFLFVLLSLCLLHFACRDVPGKLSGGNFQRVWISGKQFPRKGDYQSDRKNDWSLKVFFTNESVLRRVFQAESSARHFTERKGKFSARMELSGGYFTGGGESYISSKAYCYTGGDWRRDSI
jgi:hypothetical protein